jgi:hypothetical protein
VQSLKRIRQVPEGSGAAVLQFLKITLQYRELRIAVAVAELLDVAMVVRLGRVDRA